MSTSWYFNAGTGLMMLGDGSAGGGGGGASPMNIKPIWVGGDYSKAGVGTSNPTALLDVAGDLRVRSNATVETKLNASLIDLGHAETQEGVSPHNGRIGYQYLSADALDVCGYGLDGLPLRIELHDDVVVTGELWTACNVHVQGNATINDTLTVERQADVGGLRVGGGRVAGQKADAGLIAYGLQNLSLDIVGAGTPGQNAKVRIYNDLDVDNDLAVGGSLRVRGFKVAGQSAVAGTIMYAAGNLSLDIVGAGTPGQNHNVRIYNNLDVDNNLVVGGGLRVRGAKVAGQSAAAGTIMYGASNLSLDIVGAGTPGQNHMVRIYNNLDVNNDLTVGGKLDLSGNIALKGYSYLEFGSTLPNQHADAGKIYPHYTNDLLMIVGNGPSVNNRNIRMYDHVVVERSFRSESSWVLYTSSAWTLTARDTIKNRAGTLPFNTLLVKWGWNDISQGDVHDIDEEPGSVGPSIVPWFNYLYRNNMDDNWGPEDGWEPPDGVYRTPKACRLMMRIMHTDNSIINGSTFCRLQVVGKPVGSTAWTTQHTPSFSVGIMQQQAGYTTVFSPPFSLPSDTVHGAIGVQLLISPNGSKVRFGPIYLQFY